MNRDIELVRAQVFADYCQARFNFFCSIFVASIIGLLVTLTATTYVRQIEAAYSLALLSGVLIAGFIGIKLIMRTYDTDLDLIEGLLRGIERMESLPSLEELRDKR